MSEFNNALSQAEVHQMVGELQIDLLVWKREYARVAERLKQAEAELASLTGGAQNGHKEPAHVD